MCLNYRGITLLSLPGKAYSRVLERRLVDPQIENEQCGFRPGRGTVDQLSPSEDYWRGPGNLPNQSTWALWIWRRLSIGGPSGVVMGGAARVWGSGLCTPAVRAVFTFSALSPTHSQWVLASARAALYHRSCL